MAKALTSVSAIARHLPNGSVEFLETACSVAASLRELATNLIIGGSMLFEPSSGETVEGCGCRKVSNTQLIGGTSLKARCVRSVSVSDSVTCLNSLH